MIKDKEFLELVMSEVVEATRGDVFPSIHNVRKNNGVTYTGVVLSGLQGNIAPTVYLEPFYRMYLDDVEMRNIARTILHVAGNNSIPYCEASSDFADFDKWKDHIIFRLVNRQMNAEHLERIPHVPAFGNLALVFAILVSSDMDSGYASVEITSKLAGMWGVDADELHALAICNTPRLLPMRLRRMSDVLEEMSEGCTQNFHVDRTMHILNNKIGTFGAAAVAYPGVLAQVANKLAGDLIILPSSVHEVVVLPYFEGADIRAFEDMVKEVNLTHLEVEEVLSDSVYLYNRKTGEVTLFSDGETDEIGTF